MRRRARCAMHALVVVHLLLASGAQAQAPARRAWYTTVGEVRATDDGWVELRISRTFPVPPHHGAFDHLSGVTARFAPTLVRAWAEAARHAVNDTLRPAGKIPSQELTSGSADISLGVVRHSEGTRYEMFLRSCRHNSNVGPSRGDVILLADALMDAARAAAALRSTPADPGTDPHSLPDVTCPARIERALMPAWSAAFGPRPAARGEALARFVVTDQGRIDLATLEWDRAPAREPARRARAALAEWRYEPATVGTRRVRQWAHAVVWFADSSDAAERQHAGWTRTRSFVARRDGRVDHAYLNRWLDSLWRLDEGPRIHEAYPPAAVRSWLAGFQRTEEQQPSLAVAGGLERSGNSAGALYRGCPAYQMIGVGGVPRGARVLLDSVRAALAQAERVRLRAVDSSRVHGEAEVTCPARPLQPVAPELAQWSGVGEIALSFIVTREGRVDSTSVVALGDVESGDLAAARASLIAQSWESGRLSGVRVPQRAHLLLYPDPPPRTDVATEACARASAVAVRVRVREPQGGIAGPELTRVAHSMSRQLGLQGRPPATDGTFSLVLDDVGGPHFFMWLRPPADSTGASVVRFAFRQRWVAFDHQRVMSSIPVAALALEADLLPACP